MSALQLFHTCLVNEFFPSVGFAVVRVLERLGFSVNVPLRQTCCGQPAFNGGFHDEARAAARHTIEVPGGDRRADRDPVGLVRRHGDPSVPSAFRR